MRRSMKCPAFVAFVAFVVIGTVGCSGDRSHSPSASALIQDANHLDGNAFFVWLPPLVTQDAPAEQVFSQQLRRSHPHIVGRRRANHRRRVSRELAYPR